MLALGLLACTEPEVVVPKPAPTQAPPPLDAPWVDPSLKAPKPGRYALRELRVSWAGAVGASPAVTRTEPEARMLARQLAQRLLDGSSFAELVASQSDAPTRTRGGWLGAFELGTYDASVEAAVASVDVGAVAPLVRTTAGYHLLQRVPVDEVVVVYALYAWRGARGANVSRDKAAADFVAGEAVAGLRGGAKLDALKPDRASPPDGVRVGRDQWSPAVEAAAFALKVGAVSDPIETPAGYLVVKRLR